MAPYFRQNHAKKSTKECMLWYNYENGNVGGEKGECVSGIVLVEGSFVSAV